MTIPETPINPYIAPEFEICALAEQGIMCTSLGGGLEGTGEEDFNFTPSGL